MAYMVSPHPGRRSATWWTRRGIGPTIRVVPADGRPAPQRNRIHFDIVVPHDEAEASASRRRSLAGGRLVHRHRRGAGVLGARRPGGQRGVRVHLAGAPSQPRADRRPGSVWRRMIRGLRRLGDRRRHRPVGSVNVQPAARRSVTTVCTAARVPERSPPPSCASTISPGFIAARRLAVSVGTSWVAQSSMVLTTPSGCMPRPRRRRPSAPAPFGARKYGTSAVGSPRASRMIRRFSTRSASTCSGVQLPMSA